MDEKRKRSGRHRAVTVVSVLVAALFVLMVIGMGCGGSKKAEQRANAVRDGTKQQYGVTGEKESAATLEEKGYETVPPATGETRQDTTRGGQSPQTQLEGVPQVETRTIRTGSLTIEIKKETFNRNYGKLTLIAEGVGGYISESRTDSGEGRITGGTVTLRVPNREFGKVMEEAEKLGKVTSVSEQAQDVTEEYIDLESRINHLRSQEAVYLRLMEKAQTIEESIAVQRELSVIQQQVEQLLGRKNYLDNHVQFSTVQVTMYEPGAVVTEGEGWGFWRALSDAAHGVVDGINEVVKFLGYASVYIVIAIVLALVIYYLARRRRGRKDKDPGRPRG